MTDLGNGLFAITVPEDATEIEAAIFPNPKLGMLDYKVCNNIKHEFIGFDFQILGTVTKDNIDFDVETHVPSDHGMLNNQYYFRWLISSKGLHFENPYGETEPNITHIGKSNYTSNVDLVIKWQQAQNNLIEKLVIIKKV